MSTPRPPFVAETLVALLLVVLAGASGCADSGTSPSPVAAASVPVAPAPACRRPATFYGCAYTRQGVSLTGQVYRTHPDRPGRHRGRLGLL